MKVIYSNKQDPILVSDEDYEMLSKRRWYITPKGYVRTFLKIDGKWTSISMSRMVLGLKSGDPSTADHINHTTLDNRRENLRICTQSENNCNRKISSNNTTGYKGVTFNKRQKKWKAQIKKDGISYYLGYYEDPKEAYKAYCNKAVELFGEYACLG